jgi:hypothetical protein
MGWKFQPHKQFTCKKSLCPNCIPGVAELQYLVNCFRVGRATYVDVTRITDVDAGAYGVTVWLKAVSTKLKTCFQ